VTMLAREGLGDGKSGLAVGCRNTVGRYIQVVSSARQQTLYCGTMNNIIGVRVEGDGGGGKYTYAGYVSG
jgi:hypothetical protein